MTFNSGRVRAEDLESAFLQGGGEMGALIRRQDWAHSPLGPTRQWPQSLRSAVSICLGSGFPIAIYWGPELALLYNDAWSAIPGAKHPGAIGRPAREVWPETWDTIGPLFHHVITTGEATRSKDQLLAMRRHGYTEESYFDYNFSPIRGVSGRVEGIFNAVLETTERVIGERRLRILRELAERVAETRTAEMACQVSALTLANASADIPFALFYLLSADGAEAILNGTAGLDAGTPATPVRIPLLESAGPVATWPVAEVVRTGTAVLVDNLASLFNPLPGGPWPEPPGAALVLPVLRAGGQRPFGALVAGVSPRRALDPDYRAFFDVVASYVAQSLANAEADEVERKRAAALAEIDRAKTAFFSNVSHEFRTPITLILGPLEEILAMQSDLPSGVAELASVTHRNGLRLQKLVNTLLDFSRIEAGRVQASYEPTDLSALTAQLASTFRSAIEKAGLQFVVDCPPLPAPVYVDPEMWEKVVLNLLSNAFKFTFAGRIALRLRAHDTSAVLSVEDTGTGIPPQELPRLFERFHRVEGAVGRTREGTGIGLALLAELIKLHAGSVQVRSTLGQGSNFTISVPLGSAHLSSERIGAARRLAPTALHTASYVEEAARWLAPQKSVTAAACENAPHALAPPHTALAETAEAKAAARGKVLIADDNADLRSYLARLLAGHYDVEMVASGEEALASALCNPPDLVLSDVMMPGSDGIQLIQALRAHPETRALPVLLLSARAGDEARLEGLASGASDYLVKPFTARELLARVSAQIGMAAVRKQAAAKQAELRAEAEAARDQAAQVLESIQDGFFTLDRDWCFTYVSAVGEQLLGATREELLGKCHWDLYPAVGTHGEHEYRRAVREQVAVEFEFLYSPWSRWFGVRAYPTQQGGISVYLRDITDQKKAVAELRESRERLRAIYDGTYTYIGLLAPDGKLLEANRASLEFAHNTLEDVVGLPFWDTPWFKATPGAPEAIREALACAAAGEFIRFEAMVRRPSGVCSTFDISFHPIRNQLGEVLFIVPEGRDITDRKRAEEDLRRTNEQLTRVNRELEEFAYVASHDLQEPLRVVNIYTQLLLRDTAALEPAQGEHARFIRQGVARMQALIQDLLKFSRAVHSEESPIGEADLAASLDEALYVLRDRIAESGAAIAVQPLPTARGDTSPIAHVFQNLIANALKYRKIESAPQISIAAERHDREWVISVRDDGIGFEPRYAERIFGLFKRLHKDEYPGTGLGLAICKRIVERYGGRIWAEGRPGEGSTFHFSLPGVDGPTRE